MAALAPISSFAQGRWLLGRCRGFCRRQDPLQQRAQPFATDRLGKVVGGAEPHRLDGVVTGRHRGQNRNWRRVGARADAPEHFETVHPRHAQVEQHRIRILAGKPSQRSRPSSASAALWPRSASAIATARRKALSSSTIRIVGTYLLSSACGR
jgi:hypothetical protein